ncbi:GntR family transcriptional regulator [Pediococcus acidilactici]|uniref:GntR family transcriptional regulator n=1 Tax=Pediococcus acidilactici TaxID=1254 RepID=UPI00132721A9|nr:GntR family transcriptional regulator [Pediococcus acidilactici]KAF0335773.1 GntR family transcriptional regulator [Pediococcus acidilactici]KAF0337095.1 GntR family transcriptional regulator [Pediococcus acidilactici]KAF0339395.1 GntR family transcriptional regulator [Pediococcus acidilactici]KAF0345262.1 GntR family transcriptional regulator [Pediococcus acidilactici]KAF0348870.1 GntR family transcriptional regulator [Pediococcus acidilactici]
MHFNFNSSEPIYLQVAQQIEDAIFTGGFKEGEQIPSTTEISKEFHINPATVLKGMNQLVARNLLEKHRGVGMFVVPGACKQITLDRQQNFYQKYVVGVVKEAIRLNITETELKKLIEQGYQSL